MPTISQAVRGLVDDYVKGQTPAGVLYGTVKSEAPLVIEVNAKLTLKQTFLVVAQHLTDYEIECEITTEAIGGFRAEEHRVTVEPGLQRGKILLKNRLRAGDRVILLRLEGGQQYAVVDRIG